MRLRVIANKILSPLGLKIIPKHHDQLIYQHDYGSGGIEKYRHAQIEANIRKFHRVFADERTLSAIADDIFGKNLARKGLCHGARNGWEVEWLAKRLQCPVIGTDISETAHSVSNVVCHDFHEPNPAWVRRFSFIYTNSLDQAFNPAKALETWADQLTADGRIYVEHTRFHTPAEASEMDPFGAHPMVIPYLLHEWGNGKYALEDILHVETSEKKGKAWVFVIALPRRFSGAREQEIG